MIFEKKSVNCDDRYTVDMLKVGGKGLSSEKEIELSKKIQKGDKKALNELVKGNLFFAVKVAKKYVGQGVELDDLISSANLGLVKAVQRFDYTKGFRFISYAVWYIRREIRQLLCETSRLYTVPDEVNTYAYKINSAYKKMKHGDVEYPSITKLEKETGLPKKHIFRGLYALNCNRSLYFDRGMDTRGMDKDQKDNESKNLFLVRNGLFTKEKNKSEEINAKKIIKDVIKKLSEKDQDIINKRFGFDGGGGMTFGRIGALKGYSSQGIGVRVDNALKELKKNTLIQDLN